MTHSPSVAKLMILATRMKLTADQERRFRALITKRLRDGSLKHRGILGEASLPDEELNWVFGTTEDISNSGIKRACAVCGDDVYTSIKYPDDVAILCELCSLHRMEQEEATNP